MATMATIPEDFGLAAIASCLGREAALSRYWEGASLESSGDVDGAIKLYRQAFKMWPALDSVTEGGLPSLVRREAIEAGLGYLLLASISVKSARLSRVVKQQRLLSAADIAEIEGLRREVVGAEQPLVNNPQNAGHRDKVCIFLNNPPQHAAMAGPGSRAVIAKLLCFAESAWKQEDWNSSVDCSSPLHGLTLDTLSIRVVEHWTYSPGGGLTDPLHYDVDSVLTIVALLQDGFEGGAFRSNELGDVMLEHSMAQGDAICFISHKFHNITPVTSGVRKSLVVELWQGGVGHAGR